MRLSIILLIILFAATWAHAQKKPTIIGQKDLSTEQGKPITIHLTDLYVEETESNDGNNGNEDNGNGNTDDDDQDDDDDENGDDDENDDDDQEDDDRDDAGNEGNGDSTEDADEGEEEDDDRDEERDDEGDGEGKDKDKDKKDRGEKDDKDNKGGKDNDKGNKGKGKGANSRTSYPEGYALEIFQGDHYTFAGNTITPAASFTGILVVPVRVRNNWHASPKYDLRISVKAAAPQNVPPVITGQSKLSTSVNKPLEIKLENLQVSDPDDNYPDGFTLKLTTGQDYEINNTTTVVPKAGFSGTLTVPAIVNDGASNSQPFNLSITVVAPATAANVPPRITGQLPIAISMNQSVTIIREHLLVVDPDNDYPDDFTLKVMEGEHYTISNTTVTPQKDYSGHLAVRVSVSDGVAQSPDFTLSINVNAGPNNKPRITGQAGIQIPAGQSLTIKLSHLVVEDSDNRYPDDFTLALQAGEIYSISNTTMTPAPAFLGPLHVAVTVSDGKASSDVFMLKVLVIPADKLAIVGQRPLEVLEDSLLVLHPGDLDVNDPASRYPEGFTLQILKGEHYEVRDNAIVPDKDYFGNLVTPVAITGNGATSDPFELLVVVAPVNDAPELLNVPEEPALISAGGTEELFDVAEVYDADDSHLLFAEISISEGYVAGMDRLEYNPTDSLHVVFDVETGVLFVMGRARSESYQDLIRSIRYTIDGLNDTTVARPTKLVSIELNDGKTKSRKYHRLLKFQDGLALEIPSAFTPNNDNANDTWRITHPGTAELLNATIRVYDKKGIVVFESSALEREWDGDFNGSPLPADVYYYTIELDVEYRKLSFKGIVAILR